MTGPYDSIIGVQKEIVLRRFLTSMPVRMEAAKKGVELHAVIIQVDETTGARCRSAAMPGRLILNCRQEQPARWNSGPPGPRSTGREEPGSQPRRGCLTGLD